VHLSAEDEPNHRQQLLFAQYAGKVLYVGHALCHHLHAHTKKTSCCAVLASPSKILGMLKAVFAQRYTHIGTFQINMLRYSTLGIHAM